MYHQESRLAYRKMRNVFLVSLSILTASFMDLPSMASVSFYYCDLGFEYVATELGHVESYNVNNVIM